MKRLTIPARYPDYARGYLSQLDAVIMGACEMQKIARLPMAIETLAVAERKGEDGSLIHFLREYIKIIEAAGRLTVVK